jgi:transketolase
MIAEKSWADSREMNLQKLERKSASVRRQVLEMIVSAKKGHIGGAFSCADILTALYYGDVLRYDAGNPQWDRRDRFIMSKGHSGIVLYAILADLGFFPAAELLSFCRNESRLGGHPDRNIPGIEADTGSLGHGLGIGAGMALAARLDGKEHLTVILLGDGECYEGSIWEAALFAGHQKLSRLVAIVDRNFQCATDFTERCAGMEPLGEKWRAFNWEVKEVDGHSFHELLHVFQWVRDRGSDKPLLVIAHTIKGKGASFMERKVEWHHGVPNGMHLEKARKEISEGSGGHD